MSDGISLVFNVAENESAEKGFAGLTLLSQVCEEQMIPNVKAMNPSMMLAPSRRVGLRDPINTERATVTLLPPELPKASGHNPRSVYVYFCKEFGVKSNSVMMNSLKHIEDDFDSTSVVSGKGNLIGDRGFLPIVEMLRYCPNVKEVSFPDNGLKNTAIEAFVHMMLDKAPEQETTIAPAAATESPSEGAAANSGTAANSKQGFIAPKCSHSVQRLDFSRNRLTIGGGKLLVDLVKARPNIVDVDVSGTKIDEAILKQLTLALEANKSKQQ